MLFIKNDNFTKNKYVTKINNLTNVNKINNIMMSLTLIVFLNWECSEV